jgi:hypothetical protein
MDTIAKKDSPKKLTAIYRANIFNSTISKFPAIIQILSNIPATFSFSIGGFVGGNTPGAGL